MPGYVLARDLGERTAADSLNEQPSSVTPKVYEVLQYVSRGKGDGATVVQIGKDLGIDQRSAFHFVRVAISIGAVYVL